MVYNVQIWSPSVKIEKFPELEKNPEATYLRSEATEYLLDTTKNPLEQFLNTHKDHWIAIRDSYMYIDTRMFQQR